MESTEEEFSSFTTKGRRTKRQRSLLATSASASSAYRGVTTGGCSDVSYGSSTSASPSDDHDVMSEITTEEEDMANCLILLAQGVEKKRSNNITSISINSNSNKNIVIYECKTCNKTFSSFQALGGHRTSHKKIKPPSTTPVTSLNHHDERLDVVVDLDVTESTSVNKKIVVQSYDNNNTKARVHECSICGSEFPSGQALGGHMRRHRASVAPPSTTPMTVSDAAATTVIDTGGPRNILSLDLNLPAPDDHDDQQLLEDDHHLETKFVHVLPRPVPLVDCHY